MIEPTEITKEREGMSYSDQTGEFYLLLRQKSLRLGKSKSMTIPYTLDLINATSAHQNEILTVLDIGCLTGDMLHEMARLAPHKFIQYIGLDYNANIIKKAKKRYPDIQFIKQDIVQSYDKKLKDSCHVVLCVNTLHEIFSFYSQNAVFSPEKGYKALDNAMENIKKMLRKGSYLVIFDGLEHQLPPDKKITIKLKSKEIEKSLKLFQRKYKPYKIEFEKVSALVYKIPIRHFTRFITKYRFLNSPVFDLEMEETYQYFDQQQFREFLTRHGFRIHAINLLTPNIGEWESLVDIVDKDVDFPKEHILLIGQYLK